MFAMCLITLLFITLIKQKLDPSDKIQLEWLALLNADNSYQVDSCWLKKY